MPLRDAKVVGIFSGFGFSNEVRMTRGAPCEQPGYRAGAVIAGVYECCFAGLVSS